MILSLDIGGTNIRIAYIDDKKVINKRTIKIPKKKEDILQLIEKLLNSYDKKNKICISIAGFIRNGRVIKSPNLNLDKFDIKNWLKRKFKIPISVENDAICAAIAENKFGFGKQFKNYVFITLGTGIGGAIFVNGKLYRGKGFAGEFGHMMIEGGEFEKIASGREYKNNLNIITDNLAKGIGDIIYALDPEAIIIGGGFSKKVEIYDLIKKKIKKKDMIHRDVRILKSKFGDNAGIIGASLL